MYFTAKTDDSWVFELKDSGVKKKLFSDNVNLKEKNMANEFFEIKVSIKDSDQKLTKKFPVYSDGIKLTREDPELKKLVNKTIDDFKGDKQDCDIALTVKYIW